MCIRDRIHTLGERAAGHAAFADPVVAAAPRQNLSDRIKDLLDDWCRIAHDYSQQGATLQYQHEAGGPVRLLYEFLNRDAPPHWKFRANRSMRDVEPSVNLWLKDLDNQEIVE